MRNAPDEMAVTSCAALPPGPPGLTNAEPILVVVFEGFAGNFTIPRSKCAPYGSSQFTGTEKFAHWKSGGKLAGGHASHTIDVAVLFAGGK